MRVPSILSLALVFLSVSLANGAAEQAGEETKPQVRIGSKKFTESVVLAEVLAQLAEQSGAKPVMRSRLGATQILFNALVNGEIDVYPEYTGTITQEILASEDLGDHEDLIRALAERKIRISQTLGFNNTYALGMREPLAEELNIRKFSDLVQHPQLKFGFSNEFMRRGDGWPSLRAVYRLPQADVRGLDHDLAYRGLESGAIDVIDLYSTDAEIAHYGLRTLEDDRKHFPAYHAVFIYRADLEQRAPEFVEAMLRLEGQIDEAAMIAMNSRVKLDRMPESVVATDFVNQQFGFDAVARVETRAERIVKYTLQHLFLVSLSMIAAITVAIPLGILAAKWPQLGQVILAGVGVLQTVPSLALFVVLIPLLGLGAAPAICALFVYSLLPIVRNTHAGLHDIPLGLHESAEALGLPAGARLRLIELPLAARSILAGIKTAVVINVGTATLGGFIGAGGYGEPIIEGIGKDRTDLILEGALPAAAMALLAQGLFELAERRLVPLGLRLKAEN